MVFISFIGIAGSVALFMFGMLLVKYALEKEYGSSMKQILSEFSKNRITGFITGTFVTVALQSSSASSVLTAAFVDSGYLTLYNAFWIIVGANTGTTFTGLLSAWDFSAYSGILLVAGIMIISFCKKEKTTAKGLLLSGLGMMFTGLSLMGDSVNAIKDHEFFVSLLSSCNSPVPGIVSGAFVTALVQSSSAVTAILQSLAGEGLMDINQAYFMILGANIGTCATCAVASAGLSSGARKVSLMHILYNLAGSVLFAVASVFIPVAEIIFSVSGGNIKLSIALINIVFNSVTAAVALMLPIRKKKNINSAKTVQKAVYKRKII